MMIKKTPRALKIALNHENYKNSKMADEVTTISKMAMRVKKAISDGTCN